MDKVVCKGQAKTRPDLLFGVKKSTSVENYTSCILTW
jgi:hypothetical protein